MVLSMEKWNGKIAIVTGASAGIGKAIAEALVEAGLKVVGLARRKDRLEELSQKLSNKRGKLYAFKTDMTIESDIISAFKWTKENLGPVSILINNAGLLIPNTLIDGDTDKWRTVLDTNVLGLSIATREAIKQMRENDIDGHIVHINSVLGHYAHNIPNANVYIASKFAVTALTETLRQELVAIGSRIKVTSVSPGPVKTEFSGPPANNTEGEFTSFFESLPKLLPEDVVDAVIYTLSTPPHVQVHDVMLRPVGENVS